MATQDTTGAAGGLVVGPCRPFEGVHNFREWRRLYPANVAFRVRRITGTGNLWVVECSISDGGGPWMPGVSMHEFRDDEVVHECIYVTEPWAAPDWRAPWRASP